MATQSLQFWKWDQKRMVLSGCSPAHRRGRAQAVPPSHTAPASSLQPLDFKAIDPSFPWRGPGLLSGPWWTLGKNITRSEEGGSGPALNATLSKFSPSRQVGSHFQRKTTFQGQWIGLGERWGKHKPGSVQSKGEALHSRATSLHLLQTWGESVAIFNL